MRRTTFARLRHVMLVGLSSSLLAQRDRELTERLELRVRELEQKVAELQADPAATELAVRVETLVARGSLPGADRSVFRLIVTRPCARTRAGVARSLRGPDERAGLLPLHCEAKPV